ncbi:MAG: phosphotransferase family protein [Actinobacteria bacterium]|nr:phosphotransferase family protein [Actinomycetota bacterium]
MSLEISAVRDEDSFSLELLHTWLAEQLPGLVGPPTVQQFRSGASNLTYLLTYPDRELVLRRPPLGNKAASAHDMKREFLIQQRLKPEYPLVPQVVAMCEDLSILGSNFYVMERINGVILRRDPPAGISLTEEQTSAIGQKVIEGLVNLHSVDASILDELNKGSGYVRRQVTGWSRRYRAALTDDVPTGDELMNWLEANQPADVAACVIHGDWRLDNMVLNISQQPQLLGVLDWELATVGDPLMDLGAALAYWIDRDDESEFATLRRQPSDLPGMPTRSEFVSRYLNKTNFNCDDFTFYEIFGLFRLSVIAQQIWARYRLGQTTNPAFAQLGAMINILMNRAMGMMR